MARSKPAIGEIYHIYNRGVEKRDLFMKDNDRVRFLFSLFIFNSDQDAENERHYYDLSPSFADFTDIRYRYGGKQLVKILAYALMPNHYHLMLEQIEEDGITRFMRKVGIGYTNYFNKKYERVGPLFQGKYKAALLSDQSHFSYLPLYIHLNPLELIIPGWKENGIKDIRKAVDFLDLYRWSSHPDYLGKENFPGLVDTKLLNEVFESAKQYKNGIEDWLRENYESAIRDITIES